MARFVLWGTYCENALEKRSPFREEHLTRLKSLQDEGRLVTLGPTQDSTYVFGVFEGEDVEEIRELLEQDVYWREQLWTSLEVHPWVQAF